MRTIIISLRLWQKYIIYCDNISDNEINSDNLKSLINYPNKYISLSLEPNKN